MKPTRIRQIFTVLVLATVSRAALASPPDVRVFPSRQHEAITEGETTLSIDPDAAYREVTDYMRWSAMFPDIRRVIVTSQSGGDDRVTFVHADGNRDNIHFRNQPAARMVWFEDTGGRAEVWAEIMFLPGAQPGTTRIRSRLFADVHGFASLFVSDRKLRSIREQRVRDDLSNLRAYFARQLEARLAPQVVPAAGPAARPAARPAAGM